MSRDSDMIIRLMKRQHRRRMWMLRIIVGVLFSGFMALIATNYAI